MIFKLIASDVANSSRQRTPGHGKNTEVIRTAQG